MSDKAGMPWSEADSDHFIEVGKIHIPSRDEIQETILDLIPADGDEPFLAVELGVGAGWLSRAILERFPASSVVGLDGSATMLREADRQLRPFAGSYELRQFRLEETDWLAGIGTNVRCFVSSLVIHHLDADRKQRLYRDLYGHLEASGGLIVADLVAPRSERERRCMAAWLYAEVERQSLHFTGSPDVYREFVDGHFNWYEYPDPMDMPSSIPEHLGWLAQAGFQGTDVFWARAGHAVYGGYRGGSSAARS